MFSFPDDLPRIDPVRDLWPRRAWPAGGGLLKPRKVQALFSQGLLFCEVMLKLNREEQA